jgi:hypothetical protein
MSACCFAYFSAFANWMNIIATIALLLFFAIAIVNCIKLGIANTSNNQLCDSENPFGDKIIMLFLMAAEIGGFSVLLLGFFIRLL